MSCRIATFAGEGELLTALCLYLSGSRAGEFTPEENAIFRSWSRQTSDADTEVWRLQLRSLPKQFRSTEPSHWEDSNVLQQKKPAANATGFEFQLEEASLLLGVPPPAISRCNFGNSRDFAQFLAFDGVTSSTP